MADREKLIELLKGTPAVWMADSTSKILADNLISNGVTVRERGQWINPYINRYGHPCHCCSVCGFKASHQDKNFCPNCGADMRSEEMANEKRLIDADALMERFRIVAQSGGAVMYHVSDICAAIEDEVCEESVDAVEVVRCGECRFVDTDACPMSGTPGRVSASDFCSYGERKNEDG